MIAKGQAPSTVVKGKKISSVSYSRWGYIFIAPFFIAFAVFTLYPLFFTIYNSFFEHFFIGLSRQGPYFIGFQNYINILNTGQLVVYFQNTLIMWVLGFIPQIAVSLLLAAWFTDMRLRIRAQGLFKTVIYMPNLIMATAFSMLFFMLFAVNGPVNDVLIGSGFIDQPIQFTATVWGARGLVASMNFLMWFGNTTILLMAAMMGIDQSVFEAAEIDGASSRDIFRRITLPLINPILIYVLITSMIGGLQMFDVPQILTAGAGVPNRTTMTLIMFLNQHLFSRNYGMAGAISVILFVVMGALSLVVYKMASRNFESIN